jgi:hypothetical protein
MTDEKTVIRDSIRQVKKIYQEVSNLIKTADDLMGKNKWNPSGNAVVYESSATYYLPNQWLPSVLTREYRNEKNINTVLLMAIMLDHEDIEEPLIIGTQMSVGDPSDEFPPTSNDDRYFWFLKKANLDAVEEVVEIDNPQGVYEKETRELGPILTFATPLLEMTNSDQLQAKFVSRLLSLSQ